MWKITKNYNVKSTEIIKIKKLIKCIKNVKNYKKQR